MSAQTKNQPPQRPEPQGPEPMKVLFSWSAPERPFKRRTREFWVSVGAIASIVGLILFLIEGPISVILIISLVFLFYMLSTVEPQIIKYEITNYTINIADTQNDLNVFRRYWFGKRFDSDVLILETYTIPGRLELVIHKHDKEKIREALNKFFAEEQGSTDNIDQAANWMSSKIPGNN